MSYQPGDINNDGAAGTGADLVSLLINLNDISYNQINSIVRGSTITQKDVDYLAKHVVGDQGYELPKGGIFTRSHNLGNIAIGHNAVVEDADVNTNVENSIAIGNGASAIFNDSIAIGKNVTTDASNQIMLGHNEHTVVIQGTVGVNTTGPTCTFDISTNDALKVPVGTSIQRPTPSLGQIRYNSELSAYEGYGAGNAWGSLGGVKDVDGDTKIIAESSAGADNDQLQFFTGGNERMRIDENGNIGIGAEPSSSSKLIVSGDISGNVGNFTAMNVSGDISGNAGSFTAMNVSGDISGNTGNFTAMNVSGDISGNAGSFTAMNVSGDISGNAGSFTAMNVSGDISGNLGNFTAMNVSGDISGNAGSFTAMNVSGDISGNAGSFTAMNVSGDISGNTGSLTGLNLTNSLKIPVGDTSQRAPDTLGQIRYNSELAAYEGFGAGNAWGSLGGVKDVDGDTYILAESTAGANNNELQFFTTNVQRMIIDASGNVGIGGAPSSSKKLLVSGDVRIEGDLSLNGVMHIIDTDNSTTEMLSITNDGTGPALTINQKGSQPVMDIQDDGTSVLYVEDGGNVGINTKTPTCRLDVSSNDALKVPVGTTSQRPNPSSLGQIRYNTELNSYEGYGAGDISWNPLGFDNFKKYFSDSPPAVVFDSQHTSTGSKIFISWNYPQQVEMGAFNLYLPFINDINAEVDITTDNATTTKSILSNATGTDYIKYSSQTANSNFITGIILSNINQGTGYSTQIFPDGITRNCYVYFNSALQNVISSPNNEVRVWYENYDSNPNITSHTINIFAAAGDPSAPRDIDFSGVSSNHSTYGTYGSYLTATITVPTYSDELNSITPGSEVDISEYEWEWSSPGDTTYRYNGAVVDASENITSTSTSQSFTYLRPDSTYYFKARALNNAPNTNYGPYSDVYSTSTPALPEADHDVSLNSFTFEDDDSTTISTTDVHKVYDATKSTSPNYTALYNVLCSTVTSAYSDPKTAPVHCTETRGKAETDNSGNLLEIKCTLSGPSISEIGTLGVKGWGENISDLTSTANFSITNTSKSDKNSNNYNTTHWMQNYYQNASFTVNLLSAFFNNTNNSTQYSVKLDTTRYRLNDSVDGTSGGNAVTFYYDAVSLTPEWSNFSIVITSYGTIRTISGITTSSGDLTFDASSEISDGIGNLFYNKDQIIIYNCTGGGSETNPKTNSDLDTNATTISYPITFTRTNLTHNPGNGLYTSTTFNATAYGVTGTTTGSSNATPIDILYDQSSHSLITASQYKTSPETVGTSIKYGTRISSGSANSGNSDTLLVYTTNITTHDATITAYDNEESLLNNEDLIIYNGEYRTKGGNSVTNTGYIDYSSNSSISLNGSQVYSYLPNYNNTIFNSGYRYATFCWKMQTGVTFTSVEFKIYGASSITAANSANPDRCEINGSPLHIFFRTANTDDTAVASGTWNSAWCSATLGSTNVNVKSHTVQNFYTTRDQVVGARIGTFYTSYSGTTITTQSSMAGTANISSDTTVYLYLRIGAPMTETFNFSYVSAELF